MKKFTALLLSALLLPVSAVGALAGEQPPKTVKSDAPPAANRPYSTPFERGLMGSECFRIPGLLTLNDGTVLASADMRHLTGLDSPNNIDTVVALAPDGLSDWKAAIVNHFDDYPDGVSDENSASFIDPAVVQSKATGRIFLLTDVFPSGGGAWTANPGTGYVEVDGKKYLALTDGEDITDLSSFSFYIGDFRDGFAPVLTIDGSKPTAYSVDAYYNLYKDGSPAEMKQVGTEQTIRQNVFYAGADMSLYRTMHIQMCTSDDNGKTWNAPVLLTPSVKSEAETFLGLGPGRGFVTEYNGKERILFCVYDNAGGTENVSTIYSDDNGMTWKRGAETSVRPALKKTSEAQIVELPDGTLRMFTRTAISFVAYADSKDGGVTWSKFRADRGLSCTLNCMVSFINGSKKIDGKDVILAAFGSDIDERADGVVRVGLVGKRNKISWISEYHVNKGFYAYSCLTELADGSIALLYEDEPYHINYTVLTLSDDGTLSEINENSFAYTRDDPFFKRVARFFRDIVATLGILIGVL